MRTYEWRCSRHSLMAGTNGSSSSGSLSCECAWQQTHERQNEHQADDGATRACVCVGRQQARKDDKWAAPNSHKTARHVQRDFSIAWERLKYPSAFFSCCVHKMTDWHPPRIPRLSHFASLNFNSNSSQCSFHSSSLPCTRTAAWTRAHTRWRSASLSTARCTPKSSLAAACAARRIWAPSNGTTT